MLDVLLDALIDSLKVLGIAFIIYVILSFFEEKIAHLLEKHRKVSPILGATAGLIPQCGVSVVAADLYIKERITLGTIFAVFFACSDEALPILFSEPSKILYTIPLLLIKFVMGFSIGYLIDVIYRKVLKEEEGEETHLKGCCGHDIAHSEEESKLHEHLIHPLLHSLKIFAYVLVVNVVFGIIIYFVGEDNILNFLSQSTYLTPLVCAVVGLIPNCASSVLITELFILGGIPFGALLTGLAVNAGLGAIYLLKNKNTVKDALILEAILFVSAVAIGYLTIFIMGLF